MSNHTAGARKHLEINVEDYSVPYALISECLYTCGDAFDSSVVVETLTNLEARQSTATVQASVIGAHSGRHV